MNTSSPVRLVIVDDSELVRMGLRTLLTPEPSIEVVGEAGSVAQSLTVIRAEKPDVVLMDIRLPDGSGFDACRQALQDLPQTRIVFLTSVVDDKLVDDAIRAGGQGYLLKEINGRRLVQAIIDVSVGKSILDPEVTSRVMKLIRTNASGPAMEQVLSPQELRVLNLVAEGKTNKEIGVHLTLSEKTVKNYLANIFDKLNVSRRSQAVALLLGRHS